MEGAQKEKSEDTTLVDSLEVIATPDQEEIQEEITMEGAQKEDPEIGSIYAHSVAEPSSAISTTEGQRAVYMDPEVLTILPTFLGTDAENPINFLREFEKFCRVQKRPEGSSKEDLKLRVVPLSLKKEADAWFRGLEPNSINTWAEFKLELLNHYIPASITTARRREIREATQGYGESLGKYWNRCQSLLEVCPNHNLKEVEIYSKFYDEIDAKSKDLVNSSSGGSFYKLRLSKAKIVLKRLLRARREYEDAEEPSLQGKEKSAPTNNKDNLLESRIDKLEEALQSVIQAKDCSAIPVQTHFRAEQVNHHQSTWEFLNTNGSWNPEGQAGVYQ